MSSTMAGHLVVLRVQTPAIPAVANGRAIHRGIEWTSGGGKWREMRVTAAVDYEGHQGHPLLVQRIVSVTIGTTVYALCVAWGEGPDRDTISALLYGSLFQDLVADGCLVAHWPLTFSAGTLFCSALDADAGTAATKAKAVWPATWRVLLPTDPQGSGAPGDAGYVAPGPATGPRFIGEVAA